MLFHSREQTLKRLSSKQSVNALRELPSGLQVRLQELDFSGTVGIPRESVGRSGYLTLAARFARIVA